MATCTFTNLSKEQASELADWYMAQGSQGADHWFGIMLEGGDDAPMPRRIKTDDDGNVVVECH